MAEHVFRKLGYRTALIGTINVYINGEVVDIKRTTPTTPDCLELGKIMELCVENGVEYVFMEASSPKTCGYGSSSCFPISRKVF